MADRQKVIAFMEKRRRKFRRIRRNQAQQSIMKPTIKKDFPHLKAVDRISRLPVFESSYNFASDLYYKIKKSNGLVTWSFNSAEAGVLLAVEITLPAVLLFESPLHTVDNILCRSLDIVEERVPAINYPPTVIYHKTKDYVSSKYVQPVLQRADSVKQISLHNATKYSDMAATKIDSALDVADKYVDKYLPDIGDNPADSTEICDTSLGQISNSTNPVKVESQCIVNEHTEITSSQMIQHFVEQGEYSFMHKLKFCIQIFADDHGRGLALILKKIFSNDSEIFSFVKPRARLTGVMSGCHPERFTDTDHVIIIGGTNDITFNGGKEVFGNLEFMLISLKNTNVWLCTLPYRFDLNDSCVEHDYIILVNNYIKELASKMQHVKLIDLHKLQRHHFTVNGFCMNTRGKIRFSRAILDSISAEILSLYPSDVKTKGSVMPDNPVQLSEKKNYLRVVNPVSTGTSSSKGWNLCPPCISRLFWLMLDSTCCSSSQLTDSAVVVHGGSKTAQTIDHVNRLSRKLQRRLTRRTIAEARALKQQGADTLHCLIYLADLLARDPKAFLEKARQMWAHLSEDEPENQVPPRNLEQLIAMLTREVARRIVHLVNYTGSTVSRVPHRVGNTIHVAAYNINSLADLVLRKVHLEGLKVATVAQARIQFIKAQEVVTQIKVLGINLLERILSRMNSAVHHIHPSNPGLKQIIGPQKALLVSPTATPSSPKKSSPTQSQNSSSEQNSDKSPQSNSSSPKEQSQDQNNSTPSKKKEKGHEKEKALSKEYSSEEHSLKYE